MDYNKKINVAKDKIVDLDKDTIIFLQSYLLGLFNCKLIAVITKE